jgi:uncharacterized membrane protein (DUF4010 family)
VYDTAHEIADGLTDVYTAQLFRWGSDFCHSNLYASAEDEAKELGTNFANNFESMQAVQFCAIKSIACVILEALEEHAGTEEV